MCRQCEIEFKGQRSGKGTAILSKLFGMYACNHTPDCKCDKCKQYRDKNEYADFGFFLDQEKKC